MKNLNLKLVMLEVILIAASVLIFRSFWLILDSVPFFNSSAGIVLLGAAGLSLFVMTLHQILKGGWKRG